MTEIDHASEDPRLLRSQLAALTERNAVLEAADETWFHAHHEMNGKLAHLYHDLELANAEIERLRGENMTCPRCGAKGEGRRPPACFDCTDRVKAELDELPKLRAEIERLKTEISDHAEWAKAFAADPKNAEVVYAQDELGALRVAVTLTDELVKHVGNVLVAAFDVGDKGLLEEKMNAMILPFNALRKHLTNHNLLRKNAKDKKPPDARYGMDENEFRAWEQASDEVYDPESRSDEREEGEGE